MGSVPRAKKLESWELYKSIGQPRHVVAPMVDQSELAWRIISRLHGADLCYTPMFHAGLFAGQHSAKYQQEYFGIAEGEEGSAIIDRPLIAQFCAHDPEVLLKAASILADKGLVDAVDLNLGCPQGIAKRGRYGAFLMEEPELIESLISALHKRLSVPVTAKFRCFDTTERTVEYARMLERAGAQILTLHGRTREQKGQLTGLADWRKIEAVKRAVKVPVFANGNILTSADVTRCIAQTGVQGVMSAEGNLYNPFLFLPNSSRSDAYLKSLPDYLSQPLAALETDTDRQAYTTATHASVLHMARQYLTIVMHLKTQTGTSAVKSHLFRMWQHFLNEDDFVPLRNELGDGTKRATLDRQGKLKALLELVDEVEQTFARRGVTGIAPYVTLQEGEKPPVWYCHSRLRPLIAQDPIRDSAEPDAKRTKLHTTLLSEAKPCVGPSCRAMAAARCSKGTCAACCSRVPKEGATSDEEAYALCEAHAEKAAKHKEKRESKRLNKQLAKERHASQHGKISQNRTTPTAAAAADTGLPLETDQPGAEPATV
ncbi:uncharacterized protein L969DRAFT_75767 [Mixia osmundae IAM 14324]|uniref:tRNA-dihydrouridine(16/17) synthase [NAD(P)(+)] n=1 Tax=Mixia osmundae (strain CBS 9802 / IAM 14324 / JCM 22182 / KY 12970) TaxID=764103 RepID=G7E759_MIXOS|nr:uncharacterized protein L969DRAFT_75767 [Mixia osmundae IAM 14324]KEI38945.1 hypothetical protein L969DRAFT_75767 [Mixia osmundae IAM 14324]GAA98669.1 hypothetical protein E5Q_05357 [Mixia osmundae IAM 14324]